MAYTWTHAVTTADRDNPRKVRHQAIEARERVDAVREAVRRRHRLTGDYNITLTLLGSFSMMERATYHYVVWLGDAPLPAHQGTATIHSFHA